MQKCFLNKIFVCRDEGKFLTVESEFDAFDRFPAGTDLFHFFHFQLESFVARGIRHIAKEHGLTFSFKEFLSAIRIYRWGTEALGIQAIGKCSCAIQAFVAFGFDDIACFVHIFRPIRTFVESTKLQEPRLPTCRIASEPVATERETHAWSSKESNCLSTPLASAACSVASSIRSLLRLSFFSACAVLVIAWAMLPSTRSNSAKAFS